MTLTILYKGRALTPRDLERMEACFGEKIDDMTLCGAVILRVMQSRDALARGAVMRALDTGRCGFGDGGRIVRRIIRRTRRDLGYRTVWGVRVGRWRAGGASPALRLVLVGIWHDVVGFCSWLWD